MTTTTSGKVCGEFYDAQDNYVGIVVKLADNRYVIRGLQEYSGKVLWQSAEFAGNEFRRTRVLNLGYARVNCYTAR